MLISKLKGFFKNYTSFEIFLKSQNFQLFSKINILFSKGLKLKHFFCKNEESDNIFFSCCFMRKKYLFSFYNKKDKPLFIFLILFMITNEGQR